MSRSYVHDLACARLRSPWAKILSLTLATCALGPTPSHAASGPYELELVEVVPSVYVAQRPDPLRAPVHGNVTVIVNDTDVVVVDAGASVASAEQVVGHIRRLTPHPVSTLVLTHGHEDHVLGAQVFAESFPGIEIVTRQGTRDYIQSERWLDRITSFPERVEGIRKQGEEEVAELVRAFGAESEVVQRARRYYEYDLDIVRREYLRLRPVQATSTFDERLVLHREGREIHLLDLGPGKSGSATVVYLPDDGVVVAGDVVTQPVPFGFSRLPSGWLETLRRVGSLDFDHLVSGHGEVLSGKGYLRSVIELLEFTISEVRAAADDGLSVAETAERVDLSEWRERFAGSDAVVRRRFDQWFREPVIERAHAERGMEGGGGSTVVSERAAAVDRLFREKAEAGRFSGVVVLAKGGDSVLEAGYGWAELEHGVPMRPDHIFRIGSLTKPFTAGAVLMAVRSGRLSLQDPICGLIPGCPSSWQEVTIEHLLSHTSGIQDHFGDLEAVPVEETMVELTRVLTSLAPSEALVTPPGEAYAYRNFNYVLLGAALEVVYERPWETTLRQLVLDPLGLDRTAYDRVELPVPDRVRGYDRSGDGTLRIVDYDDHAAYAAGGLYSTARDLLTWSNAVFSGALLGELTEATFTPVRESYGYGWQIREFFDRRVFNHTGGIDGFSSHLAHYPDDGTTIIVLTNVESDSAILNACDVAAVWYDWQASGDASTDRSNLSPRVRCGLEPPNPGSG